MTQSPVSVDLNHLIRQFPKYQDPARIRTDVVNVSRQSRTLVPTRGTLTLNTGQECELLKLEGTIPTSFRGTQYHTPVEIYLTENYPSSPPTCYIRPSTGMSLKVGHRHVDQSGLVYLPYLHEWTARTHNLVQLCAHMSSTFGAEPPLFAPATRGTPNPPVRRQSRHQQQSSAGYPSSSTYSNSAEASPYVAQQPDLAGQGRPLPPRPSDADVRREKEGSLTIKLQGELQGVYNRLRTEMDAAFDTQAKLEDNQQEVDADVEELSRRKKEFSRLIEVSEERCLELDTYLEERKKEGETLVDDLIEPKDSLSNQMLRLVAENAALEDALYYLDQGVTEGAITVDVFLKEVRRLARKQFIARATMKKVEQTQRELNACKASFNAEQAGSRSSAYPHLPPQQHHAGPGGGRDYMGGPPPGYTPTAVGGNSYAIPRPYGGVGQSAAGSAGTWGGAANSGVYPSYAGGYDSQTAHTQRR